MEQDNGAIVPSSAEATGNVDASLYGGGAVALKSGVVAAGVQLPSGYRSAHPLYLTQQNEVAVMDDGAGGATDSEDGGQGGLLPRKNAGGCVCSQHGNLDCYGPLLGQQQPSARFHYPLQHHYQHQYSHPEPYLLQQHHHHHRHNQDCPHEDYVNPHAHSYPLQQRACWATPPSLAPAAWLPVSYVCPHSCVSTRARRDIPSPHPAPPAPTSLLQQRHSATLDSQSPHPPGPCPDTMPPGPRCCSLSGNNSPPIHQLGHAAAGESASGANLWSQPPPRPHFRRWPSCETRVTLDSRGEQPTTGAAAVASAAVAATAGVSAGTWNGPGAAVMATGSCRADGSPAAVAATAGEETEPPSTPAGAAAALPLPPQQLGLRFSGSSPSEQPTAAGGCGCCCGGGGAAGCGGSAEHSVCAGGATSLDPYTVRGLTCSATFEGHAAASEVVTSCNDPCSKSAPAAAAPPPPHPVPSLVIPFPQITTGLPSQCLHNNDLHTAQAQHGPPHPPLQQLHAGAPPTALPQVVIGSAGRVSGEGAGKASMMYSYAAPGPAAAVGPPPPPPPPPTQETRNMSMCSQGVFDYVTMWRRSAEAVSLAPRAPAAAPGAGCHNHGLSPVQVGLNPPCASGSSGPGTGLLQRGSSLTITHANPPPCQQLGNVITTGNSIERGLPPMVHSGSDGKLAVVSVAGAGSAAAATAPAPVQTSTSPSLLPTQVNSLTQQQQVQKVGLSQSMLPRPAIAPNAVTTGAGPLQAAAMAFAMGMTGAPKSVGGIGGCSGDERQQHQWTPFAQQIHPHQDPARALRRVQDQHRIGEGQAETLAPAVGELADDATSSCGSKDLHARFPAAATSAVACEPPQMMQQQQRQQMQSREHEGENDEEDSEDVSEEEEEQDDDEDSEQEEHEQEGEEQQRLQREQALLSGKRKFTEGPPPAPFAAKRPRLGCLEPSEPQLAPCTTGEAALPPPLYCHNTDPSAHHNHNYRQQHQHLYQLAPTGSYEPALHLSHASGSAGATLLPMGGSSGRDACMYGTDGRGPGSGTPAQDGYWSTRGDGFALSMATSSPPLSWGLGWPLQSSGTGAPPLQPLQSVDGGNATQLQRMIRGLPSCDGGSGRVRASYWDEMEPTYGSMGVSQEPPLPPPSSVLLPPESERDAMVVAPPTVGKEPQQLLQSQPPPPLPPPLPQRSTGPNLSASAADLWRRTPAPPPQSLPLQLKPQQQNCFRISASPPFNGHVVGSIGSGAAACVGACDTIAATSTTSLSAQPPSGLPVAGLHLAPHSLALNTAFPSQRDSHTPQQPHQRGLPQEVFFGNPIGHQHRQSDGQQEHQGLQQQQQQRQQQASGCARESPCEVIAAAAGCRSSRGLEACGGDNGELSGSDSRRSSHTSGDATGAAAANANTVTATNRRSGPQGLQQYVTLQRQPDGIEARPSGGGERTAFGAVPSMQYGSAPPRCLPNCASGRLETSWVPPAAPLPSCPPMPIGPGADNGILMAQAACSCPACVAQVRHQPSYASAPLPDPGPFPGVAPAGQPSYASTSAVAPNGGGGGGEMSSEIGCLSCPCEMCQRADALMQRSSMVTALPTMLPSPTPEHQRQHSSCYPVHNPPPPSGAATAQPPYAHTSTGASFGSSARCVQSTEHSPYQTPPAPTNADSLPDAPKGHAVPHYNRAPYAALYTSEPPVTAVAPPCSCPTCVVAFSGSTVNNAPHAIVPAVVSSGAAPPLLPPPTAHCEKPSTEGLRVASIGPVQHGTAISPPPLLLPESGGYMTAAAPGTGASSNGMSAEARLPTPWSSSSSLDGNGASLPALASQHGTAVAGPPPQLSCPQPPASTPPPAAHLRAPNPHSTVYAPRPPETSPLGPQPFPLRTYGHHQQPSAPCQLPEPQLQDPLNTPSCGRGPGPLQQQDVRNCPALRRPHHRVSQHPMGPYPTGSSGSQLIDPHSASHPWPHPQHQPHTQHPPAPCTACVSYMGPLGADMQGALTTKIYGYLPPANLQAASPAPKQHPGPPPPLPAPKFARPPPIAPAISPSAMTVLNRCTDPSCLGNCNGYNAHSSAVAVPLTHGQQADGTGFSHGTTERLEAQRKSSYSTPGLDIGGLPLPVLPPPPLSQATAAGATGPGVLLPHSQALQPAQMPRQHLQPSPRRLPPPDSLVQRNESSAAALTQASAAANPGPVCGICCGCGAPLPVAASADAADMAGLWQPQPCGAPGVPPGTQTVVDDLYRPQEHRAAPSEAACPAPYPRPLCDCAAAMRGPLSLTRGGEHRSSGAHVAQPGCKSAGESQAWPRHPQLHVAPTHYMQQAGVPKRGIPPQHLPSAASATAITPESGEGFSHPDGIYSPKSRVQMARGSVGAQLTHRSVAPDEEAAMWAEDPISPPWPRRSSRRL
ncbi:hypothetical protein Vafri_18474 [Volvox africanus]|uniref:Uncharacterized protein n=1 Tax=Volvox africanus TaxID=51714 RepID=A0A8J4BM41_9CHLO|nr:hypothetical protein Vafri_18474 [Volvox africanus]